MYQMSLKQNTHNASIFFILYKVCYNAANYQRDTIVYTTKYDFVVFFCDKI